jgi:hypothetical protein
MSMAAVVELASLVSSNAGESPLGWLLQALRQAIEEVMAGELAPLQKGNTVARLGALYLKTFQASEVQKENTAQARRIDELEEYVAELQAQLGTVAGALSIQPEPDRARGAGMKAVGRPEAATMDGGFTRPHPADLRTSGEGSAAEPEPLSQPAGVGMCAATVEPSDSFQVVRNRLLEIVAQVSERNGDWLQDEAAALGVDDVHSATQMLGKSEPQELVQWFGREYPQFDLERLDREDPDDVALALLALMGLG